MAINIKNLETCRLAETLSRITGETLTSTITHALEEKLMRVNIQKTPKQKLSAVLALSAEMAASFEEPYKSIDHADLLYNEQGLPK